MRKLKRYQINGDIVSSESGRWYEWFGWDYTSPRKIQAMLEEANGEAIEFTVNSGGGSVFDGYEIHNAILEYKGKTTAKISLAGSAASFIALAMDKTEIYNLGNIMIHRAATGTSGNKHVHDSTSNFLDTIDNTIVNAYIEKTGKTREEMVALMDQESWFTPEQALELGLVDHIITKKNAKAVAYNGNNEKMQVVAELLKLGSPDNVDEALVQSKLGLDSVNNAIDNRKQEEGVQSMTLNEFREKHGDLYNQIVEDATKEAITNERGRIKEINDLAVPGVENIIQDGIDNGLEAGQVAVNIVKAQKEKGLQHVANTVEDAAQLENVANTATPNAVEEQQAQDQAKDEATANALAETMNKRRGGK